MDLIRIYSEIAFSKVAERFLSAMESSSIDMNYGSYILPYDIFMDEARIHHHELSDDNLTMIYQVGVDDWSKFGFKGKSKDESNLFQVLACISSELLEDHGNTPLVHFKDLFRWREITQLLGEDLLTCSFLAFSDRDCSDKHRRFDWPTVIHNDNPHLEYLFNTKKLCELHSHLKASTNTFEITWVSLMNHISGYAKEFEALASRHEPSMKVKRGSAVYQYVKDAASLRWRIYQALMNDYENVPSENEELKGHPFDIEKSIDNIVSMERRCKSDSWIPDYICLYQDSPMSVYAGERWFLYSSLRRIFKTNDKGLTYAFYRYVLIKSYMRSFMVQINKNIGFSNFQRFQDLKSKFLRGKYSEYLETLPIWEAKEHNFTKVFETRIAPLTSKSELKHKFKVISSLLSEHDEIGEEEIRDLDFNDWTLIFHFIKRKDKYNHFPYRDFTRRTVNKDESRNLSQFQDVMDNPAIDAASSEFSNRPEAFSHSFRFLRSYGFNATFHAGEDFYDLADGLRAIDEAIHLLQLKASDRIGHALALGIDAVKYYETRHNYIVLPKQWMLDNVVWLLTKTKEFGICIDAKTEWFLNETYKCLCNEIGYSSESEKTAMPDLHDYRESMLLRGDDPELYSSDGKFNNPGLLEPESWEYYSFVDSDVQNKVRKYNRIACRLYNQYHSDNRNGRNIRKNGDEVKTFHLPEGYAKMITSIQDEMMKDISKRQLCIECCPSSNVRIGRLERFENHPIFRFMPVNASETRYPLAVTVNTDDLGVFSTSLPNEYSLLALALLKKKDADGTHLYSTQEVYDWISRVIDNGHKFTFVKNHDKILNDRLS